MYSLSNVNVENINAFAHSKLDGSKEKFSDHCKRTENYYNKIFKEFGITKILGNLLRDIDNSFDVPKLTKILESFVKFHDVGKLTKTFQKRLDGNNVSETHSDKSFFVLTHDLLLQQQNEKITSKEFFLLFLLLYVVYKHHGKLENIIENISEFRFDKRKSKISEISLYLEYTFDDKILSLIENDKFWKRWNLYASKELFKQLSNNSFSLFILIKLFYSLLTASDYYATLEYMENKTIEFYTLTDEIKTKINEKFHETESLSDEINFNVNINIKRGQLLNLDIADINCENQDDKFENLNKLRSKINIEAEKSIEKALDKNDSNVFFLNIPTGGGKTNISMRLAIKIMERRKNIRKLFYVFPFINIIEQTYDGLEKFIGTDNMTRLDSRYIDPSMSDDYSKEKLYANHVDNLFFNKPVLFLSHVKFFDLFFRNDKNSNYNFYQLANSIVIIDEIQAYNDTVWTEISHIFSSFGKYMNTHFIVMSATLPKLEKLSNANFSYLFNENFTNKIFKHCLFKRTEIIRINTKKAKILSKVKAEKEKDKILVVFNKVKDSKEFFENVQSLKEFKDYEKYLLNSTILEEKRKNILKASKKNDKKILLIATQSIEAGVDIDFDVGFRAYAPWDSIVQVAGRINRNNKKTICKLFVFKDDDYKQVYRGDFKAKNAELKEQEFFNGEAETDEEIDNFYKDIINSIEKNNKNPFIKSSEGNIADIKNLYFNIVNKEIYLINGETISLFIPKNDDAKALWDEYKQLFENENSFEKILKIKSFRKKLQKYSLNIFDAYTKKGKISHLIAEEIQFGFYYCADWEKYYSVESGLDVSKFKEKLTGREALFI